MVIYSLAVFLLVYQTSLSVAISCDSGEPEYLQVTAEPKLLKSPGYDEGSYKSNMRCYWKLIPTPGYKFIKVRFLDIDLPNEQRCRLDYVEINYDDSIPPYLLFCGKNASAVEEVFVPSDSNPVISFVSQMERTRSRGFQLEYSLVTEKIPCKGFECSHKLECIAENLVCDGKADCYDGSDEEGPDCGQKVKYPEVCGFPKIPPVLGNDFDRIVGGRAAVPFSWPWQVSIQANYIWPSGQGCGGALINNLWILTAAHCVSGSNFRMHRIKLGMYAQDVRYEGEQMRFMDMFYMHPNFNMFVNTADDIALIKLASPVTFTETVSPICLPEPNEALPPGTKHHATGWGDDGTSWGRSNILKQVEIERIDWQECRDMLNDTKPITHNMMCAGLPEGGHNTCFGDSGGPLMSRNLNHWTLYGIVAWGPSVCGIKTQPAVFTEVAKYMDWIKDTIENN